MELFLHLPFVDRFDDESAGSLQNYIGVECALNCGDRTPPEMLVKAYRHELSNVPTLMFDWTKLRFDKFPFSDTYEENPLIDRYEIITKMAWEGPNVGRKPSILSPFRGQYLGEFKDTYAVLEFGDFTLCAGVQKGSLIFDCSYFTWHGTDGEGDRFKWSDEITPKEVKDFIAKDFLILKLSKLNEPYITSRSCIFENQNLPRDGNHDNQGLETDGHSDLNLGCYWSFAFSYKRCGEGLSSSYGLLHQLFNIISLS